MSQTNKITVLIADDSILMRQIITGLLGEIPEVEVVGEARSGTEVIEMASQLRPAVITMDLNMPEINGVEATKKILSISTEYRPGILMLSAHTRSGAEETLKSLRAGAVDFIAKPSGEISLDLSRIKTELKTKIFAVAKASIFQITKDGKSLSAELPEPDKYKKRIAVIGASTGAPPLIEEMIKTFPKDFPATIIIAQHMPKFFTKVFAERLNKNSKLRVQEAQDGQIIEQGKIYVLPGDSFVTINTATEKNHTIRRFIVEKEPEHKGTLVYIDRIMEAIAEEYHNKAIGVVLSGMGEDGKEGMKLIRQLNGYTIAQDPATAVIESMPQAVIDANAAIEILTPPAISQRIIDLCT